MSKTYIAHLQERYIEKRPDGEEWLQMPVDVSGHELMVKTIIPLTPYTEPDMEKVNAEKDKIYDEARERGYKEGQARGYQEGIYDMHEAVKKLIGDVEDDSFRSGCMVDLFACEHAMTVMTSGRPGEIIKKVKELEDRQKALQKEADLCEVRDVLRTTAKECHVTFDEIAEVLSGIMGEKTDGQE